jgi:nucleotide-binding universal stress UspA family protein
MTTPNKYNLVVGFDGSPSSVEALRWALNEANERNFRVEIIYSWSLPGSLYPFPIAIPDSEDLYNQAKEFIEQLVKEETKGFSSVEVTLRIVEGAAGSELVEYSKDSTGLVVGAKNHDTLSRLLIGSVSHYVIAHAECPVTIVKQIKQRKE